MTTTTTDAPALEMQLEQPPANPLRDEIVAATDALDVVRRDYFQQRATYEQIVAAAQRVLRARIAVELSKSKRAKTKITPVAISTLIRG